MKRERGELCYQVEAEEEFLVNSLQRQLERVHSMMVHLNYNILIGAKGKNSVGKCFGA